jgi:hypothetical protein
MAERLACYIRLFLLSLVWLYHSNCVAQTKVISPSLISGVRRSNQTNKSSRQRRVQTETSVTVSDTEGNKRSIATVIVEGLLVAEEKHL